VVEKYVNTYFHDDITIINRYCIAMLFNWLHRAIQGIVPIGLDCTDLKAEV